MDLPVPIPIRTEPSSLPLGGRQGEERPGKKKESRVARSRDFDQLVAPLEAIGDEHGPRRLYGAGLDACLEAHRTHPDGFAVLVQRVLANHEANDVHFPLGVLCHKVFQGEHETPPPPPRQEYRSRWQVVDENDFDEDGVSRIVAAFDTYEDLVAYLEGLPEDRLSGLSAYEVLVQEPQAEPSDDIAEVIHIDERGAAHA